jgi:hypothetical protein
LLEIASEGFPVAFVLRRMMQTGNSKQNKNEKRRRENLCAVRLPETPVFKSLYSKSALENLLYCKWFGCAGAASAVLLSVRGFIETTTYS